MSADVVRVDAINSTEVDAINQQRLAVAMRLAEEARREAGFSSTSSLRPSSTVAVYEAAMKKFAECDELGLSNAPTAVYRYFARSGKLLYVGCSSSPARRDKEHARSKAWYRAVARHSIQWFRNRADALAVESVAIASESPSFNIRGVAA